MNMFNKNDLLLSAIIIAFALTATAGFKFYMSDDRKEHKVAIIKVNGAILYRIDLEDVKESWDIVLSDNSGEVIRVEKGRIRFLSADCPDNLCVKSGWLSKKGDTAVCLPNRVLIKIEGLKVN